MILNMEDRIEIQDLLANYCFYIDDHNWEGFCSLFHPDAVLDFVGIGGPKGSRKELVDFFKGYATHVSSWQHTISTNVLNIKGGCVKSRTTAQVMTLTKSEGNDDNVAFFGFWYKDTIVKERSGWCIKERVVQPSWSHNLPVE